MKKSWYFIIVIMLIFFSCERKQNFQSFHTIEINKKEKTIVFSAYLNLSVDDKYFLFYFEGYPWLKQHCLFVSSSTLKDLQLAIAHIDWQLWDKVYTKKFSPAVSIEFYIDGKGWKNLNEIIFLKNFDTYQTTFWGSPVYDSIVLERNYKTSVCNSCEFLPLEKEIFLSDKKVLNYKFLFLLSQKNFKVKIKFL